MRRGLRGVWEISSGWWVVMPMIMEKQIPLTEHGRGGLSPMDLTLGEVCDEKVIREVIV